MQQNRAPARRTEGSADLAHCPIFPPSKFNPGFTGGSGDRTGGSFDPPGLGAWGDRTGRSCSIPPGGRTSKGREYRRERGLSVGSPVKKSIAAVGHYSNPRTSAVTASALPLTEPSTSSDMPYAQQAHSCSHSLASRPSFLACRNSIDTRQPLAGAFRNNSTADGRLWLLSHSNRLAISAA